MESMVQPWVPAGDPNLPRLLWLLQPSASGRIQQKVFPENESTGLQSETVLIREAKPEDDLVYGVLSGPSARPRYLLILAVFEPGDGNVREGDRAKEV